MQLLLLSKIRSSFESWVVKVIVLIWWSLNHLLLLLHGEIIGAIVLSHNIVSRYRTLIVQVLIGIHLIKLGSLALLENHATLIVVVIKTLVVFVDWIERISMLLLISLATFISASLLIHSLVVLIVYVIATATRLTSLAVIFGCERVTMTASITMISTEMTSFTSLHLILNELLLHLVLILDFFHFLIQ